MQRLAVERHLDAQACLAADPARRLLVARHDNGRHLAAIVQDALQPALEVGECRVAPRQHVKAFHVEDGVVGREALRPA